MYGRGLQRLQRLQGVQRLGTYIGKLLQMDVYMYRVPMYLPTLSFDSKPLYVFSETGKGKVAYKSKSSIMRLIQTSDYILKYVYKSMSSTQVYKYIQSVSYQAPCGNVEIYLVSNVLSRQMPDSKPDINTGGKYTPIPLSISREWISPRSTGSSRIEV